MGEGKGNRGERVSQEGRKGKARGHVEGRKRREEAEVGRRVRGGGVTA